MISGGNFAYSNLLRVDGRYDERDGDADMTESAGNDTAAKGSDGGEIVFPGNGGWRRDAGVHEEVDGGSNRKNAAP